MNEQDSQRDNRFERERNTEREDFQRQYARSLALTVVLAILAGAFYLVWNTERLRYDIAKSRIELEREIAKGAQEIERERIAKATTLSATQSPIASVALGAGGAAGFALLRDLIEKGLPAVGMGAGGGEKRSTSAIGAVIDALVSAGQITATEAKSLKNDLQKAGIEIGVDAAKALIDRFIRVHERPQAGAGAAGQTFQGATQVNMYCNASPPRVLPPPRPASAPKRTCP
jgi:hypothetical protein